MKLTSENVSTVEKIVNMAIALNKENFSIKKTTFIMNALLNTHGKNENEIYEELDQLQKSGELTIDEYIVLRHVNCEICAGTK